MSRQISAKKRIRYSPESMALAIDMVRKGVMNKKQASTTYGVPRTTLLDKLAGRVPEAPTKPGPAPVLTKAEEEVLVNYCNLMAEIGYPLKRHELKKEVQRVLNSDGRSTPFKENLPGNYWFRAFINRHPDLTERTAMSLGHERAIISKEMLQVWFDGVHTFLEKEIPDWKLLLKDPRRIFNADESGFPLCVSSGKVLAPRGARHVYQVTPNDKTQITVMVCFNAYGDYQPPIIVYPGQRFRDVGISGFEEAVYGHTDNGWMDSGLFVEFLVHLVEFAKGKGITFPILLFVDGHSTHMTLQAAEFCKENDVILYCLLPNATHILQPCDVGLFSTMKKTWGSAVKNWQMNHIGEVLTKKCFPEVFRQVWYSVTTLENAVHGFRRCGLFPFTPKGVDTTKLGPSKLIAEAAEDKQQEVPPTASTSAESIPPAPVVCTSEAAEDKQQEVPPTASTSAESIPPAPVVCTSGAAATSQKDVSPRTCLPTPTSRAPLKVAMFRDNTYVSKAFETLQVPEIKPKKVVNRLREKLPKAISGSVAIKMLKEREEQKKAEEEAKAKRKEEREQKKKEREELKEKKRAEREEKKMKTDTNMKKAKCTKKGQKRKKKAESSDENEENIPYMDSDDSLSSFDDGCPGCGLTTSNKTDWVGCNSCPTWWHKWCAGEDDLVDMPYNQLVRFKFICMLCQ